MLPFLPQSFSTLKLKSILLNSLLLKRTNCREKPGALHQTEYNTISPQKQKDTTATIEKDKSTRRKMGAAVYLLMRGNLHIFKRAKLSSEGGGMDGIQPV